jgi:hypothetical protein
MADASGGKPRPPVDAAAALANYRALVAKVDAKVAEISARHPAALACRAGCHGCCQPGLTVNSVEAAHLAAFLAADPARRARAREAVAADAHAGTRCALLAADGRCSVYEARPIVCRSHGVPVQVLRTTIAKVKTRDVCPLNFVGLPLAELPAGDLIDLDTLNTLMALIDAQHGGAGTRTPLAAIAEV